MSLTPPANVTAFREGQCLATGPLSEVLPALKRQQEAHPQASILVFSDEDGCLLETDLRGDIGDLLARLTPKPATEIQDAEAHRGPGRPRLGVVAREITLLPRHWEWLATQPGGASVALRKLVEEARRQSSGSDRKRQSREAAYRFMSAMAGDEAGFEEASRALFAGRETDFEVAQQTWPADIRAYAHRLATASFAPD